MTFLTFSNILHILLCGSISWFIFHFSLPVPGSEKFSKNEYFITKNIEDVKLLKSYEFLPGTMKPPKYIVMTSKDALGISHASHSGKEMKMTRPRDQKLNEWFEFPILMKYGAL